MKTLRSLLTAFALLALTLALGACAPSAPTPNADGPAPLRIVATTTMLEDLVRNVGGEDVAVVGIMKPGGDPHLYQPTPSDARNVASADVVVTNGLKLEGWVDQLVRNAGGDAVIVVGAEGIEPLKDPSRTGYPDPHIWHDVAQWKRVTHNVADALAKHDAEHAEAHRQRAEAYLKRLDDLDAWVKERVQTVPERQRVLVTSHDAFQYYGRAYGLEVLAVQGVSTEAEAGSRDVARVVDVVRERHIPAVFVETSVNPKLVEQISRETGASIGGTLYSDSLGASPPENTYEGMIRANTERIATALNPEG